MAGYIKTCTNLTGLAVSRNPHQRLKVLYTKILTALTKIPQEAAYRRHTETLVKQRLAIVESEPDALKLEEKINSGQLEEVITQAERELKLTSKMLEYEVWQPLVDEAPPRQWQWPIV